MKREFSHDDIEWQEFFIKFCEKLLRMEISPVIIRDRKHFNKKPNGTTYNGNQLMGECVEETGLIWISKSLYNKEKSAQMNTLLHECLHIKFPRLAETTISSIADQLIPYDRNRKFTKRKVCQYEKFHKTFIERNWKP